MMGVQTLKITVIGRGRVGGGLARLWRQAGHEVTEIGRDGGDASDAEVIVVAVPGSEIASALGRVSGLKGQVTIDATNAFGPRTSDFRSLADEVKSFVGGPVVKAFNTNYAALYEQVAEQRVPPSNLYAGDDQARAVVEQLSRDAGYAPLYAGGLDKARALEDRLQLEQGIATNGLGPFFYRYAKPGEL
jgi:8-hydroxy-5-deazaflavin:NADPH oxidoreductase